MYYTYVHIFYLSWRFSTLHLQMPRKVLGAVVPRRSKPGSANTYRHRCGVALERKNGAGGAGMWREGLTYGNWVCFYGGRIQRSAKSESLFPDSFYQRHRHLLWNRCPTFQPTKLPRWWLWNWKHAIQLCSLRCQGSKKHANPTQQVVHYHVTCLLDLRNVLERLVVASKVMFRLWLESMRVEYFTVDT